MQWRAKYLLVVFAEGGAVAWIASVNWQNVAGTVVLLASTMVGGFLTIRQMIRADRRKYEAENKDSLMCQIEELNRKLASSADQDRDRGRKIAALQRHNESLTSQMERLSQLLMESNERNAELMRQMERHQQAIRDAGHRVADQMAGGVAIVQDAAARIEGATTGLKDDVEKNREAILKVASGVNIPVHPPLTPEGGRAREA